MNLFDDLRPWLILSAHTRQPRMDWLDLAWPGLAWLGCVSPTHVTQSYTVHGQAQLGPRVLGSLCFLFLWCNGIKSEQGLSATTTTGKRRSIAMIARVLLGLIMVMIVEVWSYKLHNLVLGTSLSLAFVTHNRGLINHNHCDQTN